MASGNKKLQLDLISDMHVDKWSHQTDWAVVKTSDIVIVAGDIAARAADVKTELERLSVAYGTVLYIEGNHEHYGVLEQAGSFDVTATEDNLRLIVAGLPNVHYLKDNVFIRDGIAIVGRNGFWDHQLGEGITVAQGEQFLADKWGVAPEDVTLFTAQAQKDFEDLRDEVRRLNDDPSIHTIVMVTHTLPHKDLLSAKVRKSKPAVAGYNGNSQMEKILSEDKNKKIKHWFFGHLHMAQAKKIEHVDFASNPRGVPQWGINNYTPLQVEVDTTPPPAPAAKPVNMPKPDKFFPS